MSSAGTSCSASIFVLIISFMPEGLVPGIDAALALAWRRRDARRRARRTRRGRGAVMTALAINALCKSFGGLRVTARRRPRGRAGRAAADHRPERRRQDHAVQPDHRRAHARQRLDRSCSAATSRGMPSRRRAHLGLARTYQIITLFPRDTLLHNVMLALLGLSPLRWNPFARPRPPARPASPSAREALARVGLGHHRRAAAGANLLWRAAAGRDRDGAGAEAEGAAARRAVRRTVDRRAARCPRAAAAPSRAT